MDNDPKKSPPRLTQIASQAISQVLWTFSNDLCNKLVENGVSKELLNEVSSQVLQQYVDTGIKLKPAVTARIKRDKTPNPSTSNVLSLIKNKKKDIHNVHWIPHPSDSSILYTTDIKFHTKRYPLMKDNKLVGMVDDKDSYAPTEAEIGEAQLYGFEI